MHEKNGNKANASLSQREVFFFSSSFPDTLARCHHSQASFYPTTHHAPSQISWELLLLGPSAKVSGFPWLQGSWCLDILRDALQLSCKSSFYHTHPCLPSSSCLPFPFYLQQAIMLTQDGVSFWEAIKERREGKWKPQLVVWSYLWTEKTTEVKDHYLAGFFF